MDSVVFLTLDLPFPSDGMTSRGLLSSNFDFPRGSDPEGDVCLSSTRFPTFVRRRSGSFSRMQVGLEAERPCGLSPGPKGNERFLVWAPFLKLNLSVGKSKCSKSLFLEPED